MTIFESLENGQQCWWTSWDGRVHSLLFGGKRGFWFSRIFLISFRLFTPGQSPDWSAHTESWQTMSWWTNKLICVIQSWTTNKLLMGEHFLIVANQANLNISMWHFIYPVSQQYNSIVTTNKIRLVVCGVHRWVGVRLLGLLLLVSHNHLHRLRPRADLRLFLLSHLLVVVQSCGVFRLNVGQVLKRRHLEGNWRDG